MDLGISNKLALVTGASKGIGRAIALQLAREGARIIGVARSAEALEALSAELSGQGHHMIVSDLTLQGASTLLASEIAQNIGPIEIVVHNLGGSHGVFDPFSSSADWARVWQFNVGISHELNRLVIPGMTDRKWGRVIHLSTLSTRTFNGYAPYVAAKTALNGYVKTMNRTVAKHNVIISAVAPGAIYSEGRHFAKLTKENPAALESYFDEHLPTRRLGRAEDVAAAVAFLASEQASFMAGAIVGVDGGGY